MAKFMIASKNDKCRNDPCVVNMTLANQAQYTYNIFTPPLWGDLVKIRNFVFFVEHLVSSSLILSYAPLYLFFSEFT
jgi:hypothetical protein